MIENYSNPHKVLQKAKRIFGNDVNLQLSTREDKKYMLLNPNTNKWVHFGQIGFLDYTKSLDLKKREAFRIRNKRWANQDMYTAGFLSYYLLW